MIQAINALREQMRQEHIDYYLVTSGDDHNSEYVAPHFHVIAYLTGFTGSAGTLLVSSTDAYLWTDGRYFLQAEEQLKESDITLMRMGEENVPDLTSFLIQYGKSGEVLGLDGRMVNAAMYDKLVDKLSTHNITVLMNQRLAAKVWEENNERPALSFQPIFVYEDCYAGESRTRKCQRLREFMEEKELSCYVMIALDEIAWLLNLRGQDICYNPVFLAYLVATKKQLYLYVNRESVSDELAASLKRDYIVLRPYHLFYEELHELGYPVSADERTVNASVADVVQITKGQFVPSPIIQWKAVKNETEIAGEKKAHIKDASAMVQFLYWLKHLEVRDDGCYVDETGAVVTECSLAVVLERYRRQQEHYRGESFAPIIAFGEHGAIVHYSATKEKELPIKANSFLLMDTGGQYLEGTTDITRTVAMGEVSPLMKQLYTAVLAGNLELSHAVFKDGVRGENLDILARMPLWRMGYDYLHGTGHGVGCFLNVHEAPVSIRTHIFDDNRNSAIFKPGMITSNEPGVYLAGEFGIRLENMMVCVDASLNNPNEIDKKDKIKLLGFETMTLVPWERDAIMPEQLTKEQLNWLNEYHSLVYETVAPLLSEQVKQWLFEITRPIL